MTAAPRRGLATYVLKDVQAHPSTKTPAGHQDRALAALQAWQRRRDELRGGILVLPTGGGKTFTATRYLTTGPLTRGHKVPWLAHTHHLLDQAFAGFGRGPDGRYELGHVGGNCASVTLRTVSGTIDHGKIEPSSTIRVSLPSVTAALGPVAPGDLLPGFRRTTNRNFAGPQVDSSIRPRRLSSAIRLPGLSSQFTDQTTLHHAVVGSPAAAPSIVLQQTPLGTASTALAADPHSTARSGVLVSEADEPTFVINREAVEELRKALTLLQAQSFSVRELPLGMSAGARSPGMPWRCLIFELSRKGDFAYLLEKEKLSERDFGPLIAARRPLGRPADDAALLDLLASRVGQRTWPAAHLSWSLGRVPHAYTTPESLAAAILNRIQETA